MTVTLTSFIESITNPNGRFRTLDGIYAQQSDESPWMKVADDSVIFNVVYKNERYLIRCIYPASPQAGAEYRGISTFSELIESPYLTPFKYLEQEMLVFDNRDNGVYCDVVMQKIPPGERLYDFMGKYWQSMREMPVGTYIAGLAGMAKWMDDNQFSHGRISNKTIWVTPSFEPLMIDYSRATRENPLQDVRSLGSIAAIIYITACEPDFHILLRSSDQKEVFVGHPRCAALMSHIGGVLGEDGPAELREVVAHCSMESQSDAHQIYSAMAALAECAPVRLDPIRDMISRQGLCETEISQRGGNSMQQRLSKFRFIGKMQEMMCRAFDGQRWCYIDKNGNIAIEGDFRDAGDFYEGRAVVEAASGYGLIDNRGRYVIPPDYDDIEPDAPTNMLIVTKDGLSGLFSREGEQVTGLAYDRVMNSSEGLFAACRNRRFGYIRPDGTVAIDFQYDDAFGFREGAARVSLRGREYLIDTKGKVIDEVAQPKRVAELI